MILIRWKRFFVYEPFGARGNPHPFSPLTSLQTSLNCPLRGTTAMSMQWCVSNKVRLYIFDLVSALSQIKQQATGHGWWSKNTQCIVFRWEIHHHHCTFWIQPFCSTFKSCAPLSRTYVIISYTMITYLLHSGWLSGWFEIQGKREFASAETYTVALLAVYM